MFHSTLTSTKNPHSSMCNFLILVLDVKERKKASCSKIFLREFKTLATYVSKIIFSQSVNFVHCISTKYDEKKREGKTVKESPNL